MNGGFHFLEHCQSFDFVFDERRPLPVSTQVDAFAQHVHVIKVFHPLVVDDSEHDDFFKFTHDGRGENFFALFVNVGCQSFQTLFEFVAAEFFKFRNLQTAGRRVNFFGVFDKFVELPLFGIKLFVRVLVEFLLDDVVDHARNVVAKIFAAQNFSTFAVHDFALLIHNVIIFQNVLADVEVARLNFFLRVLNRPRDKRVLNRFVFFHAELVHDFGNGFGGEQAHQVIFERNVKSRFAGVTLTTRTSAQLVIDSPRFVSLRADNEKPAEFGHAVAEFDVGAATRHIRRNCDGVTLTRVGNNLGFLFVKLRVQNAVRNAALFEVTAQFFGLLNRRGANQNGLTFGVNLFDGVGDGAIFRPLVFVDNVGVIDAANGLVRRNDDDGQLVNLEKFVLFGFGGTRHAGKLFVHAEVVLESYRRQSLRFALNSDAFFRLDCLM